MNLRPILWRPSQNIAKLIKKDRFVVNPFTAAKKMGIHTALDTNGSPGCRLSDSDLQKVDLVLLDIKAWDPENHQRITGYDIAPVLGFAKRLSSMKKPVWLRYVLVPGYTNNTDEVNGIAKFVSALGNVERADVLPFHQMGRFKWKEPGIPYTLENVESPSPEETELVCSVFREEGLLVY